MAIRTMTTPRQRSSDVSRAGSTGAVAGSRRAAGKSTPEVAVIVFVLPGVRRERLYRRELASIHDSSTLHHSRPHSRPVGSDRRTGCAGTTNRTSTPRHGGNEPAVSGSRDIGHVV